jgi:hypothetical protein
LNPGLGIICLFNNLQIENRLKSHSGRHEQSGFPAAASLNRLYRQLDCGRGKRLPLNVSSVSISWETLHN